MRVRQLISRMTTPSSRLDLRTISLLRRGYLEPHSAQQSAEFLRVTQQGAPTQNTFQYTAV